VKDAAGNSATLRARVALLHIIGTSRLLKVMKANPRALFTAAAKAQEAATYLDGLQNDTALCAAA
jgi:antirestriction protein ArdC